MLKHAGTKVKLVTDLAPGLVGRSILQFLMVLGIKYVPCACKASILPWVTFWAHRFPSFLSSFFPLFLFFLNLEMFCGKQRWLWEYLKLSYLRRQVFISMNLAFSSHLHLYKSCFRILCLQFYQYIDFFGCKGSTLKTVPKSFFRI